MMGSDWILLAAQGLAAILVMIAAFCDLRWRMIPNMVSVGIVLVVGGAAIAAGAWAAMAEGILSAAVIFALTFFAFTRGALGGGDVKLATALAAVFGLGQTPVFLLATALAGGVLALLFLVAAAAGRWRSRRRLSSRRMELPYGVAIAAGAAIAFWGDPSSLAFRKVLSCAVSTCS